jgi:hypothetical protein
VVERLEAFSGGELPVGRWLAGSPAWLGCLALSYPLLRGCELRQE